MSAAKAPSQEATPASIALRIQAGDSAAEAELAQRYSGGVRLLLRRLTRDWALADDLHQETFRLALEKIRNGELRQPDRLAPFLRSTARYLAIGAFRRSGRYLPEEQGPQEARDDSPDPLGRLLKAEEGSFVRRLLGELRSERDRQILIRFCLAEQDKEEICDALELTSQQFNVVLFRARQRFRSLVQEARKGKERDGS